MATVTSSTRKLNPTSNTYETNSGLTVGTNIVVGGTVDGRDIASDGSKLDGIAVGANNYSLPAGSSSTRGGFKIGYTQSGKNYPIVVSSEQMYVNVPWTDTNTTYSVGDGGLTQKNFTTTLKSKLDGIAAGATNVTNNNQLTNGAGYVTTNTTYSVGDGGLTQNNFTDADHTKLNGIATGADVTPSWVPSSDPTYATQSYVGTQISNLVGGAPAALDTLNELAAAIGDDASYASSITSALAAKAPLASPTFTGTVTTPNLSIGSGNKIKFANNDYIRYDDANGVGRFHFDSDGGTNNSSVQAATFVGALSGNASTATKWATARTLSLTGEVTGSVSWDGSGNASLATTMNNGSLDDQYVTVGSRHQGNGSALSAANKASIRLWDVSEATDDPSGSSDGLVLTAGWDSNDWAVQQYHDFHSNDLYLRSKQSGTWMTTWDRVFHDTYHPNADTLTTARTIAGTSFNGSANIDISYNNLTNKPTIPTNNNQLTNGAGYVTTDTNTTYSVGDGGLTQKNFTTTLKTKLDGIATSANNYALPAASSSTRGGVKIGYTESGKYYPVELSAEKMFVHVPWVDTNTNTTYSVGDGGLTQKNFTTTLKTKLDGIATSANNYSLPAGSSSTRGGFKIGYTESGKNYPVEVSSEKMYVNVPWSDSNTTYSVGDGGLTQKNFTSTLKTKLDGIATGADVTPSWVPSSNPNYLTTETNLFLGDGGGLTTAPATSTLIYTGALGSSVSGLFSASDNSNSVITLNRHAGNYDSQLGFSSNGSIYYRKFSGTAINTTLAWNEVWHSGSDGSGSGLDADKLDGQHASAFQAAGTYNTIIGTDSDITTSNAEVVNNIYMTDGVITSHTKRTLTLANLGYTGATNANYITNNNQLTNGAGYVTTNTTYSVGDGGLTQKNFTTALKTKLDGIATGATNVTNNNQLTNGAGYVTTNTTYSVGDGGLTQKNFTSTLKTKLDGIATGATNVTNNNQLTNGAGYVTTNTTYSVGDGGLTQKNFTTTLKSKLDGIATSANNYVLPTTISGTRNFSGLISANAGLRLGDNDKIQLGDSQDLEIAHYSVGQITNKTGDLYISSTAANTDIIFYAAIGATPTEFYRMNGGTGKNTFLRPVDISANLDVTGVATADAFRTDTSNTDYNLITRNSTSGTLYVQAAQSNSTQTIASFRYGSATVNQGTETFRIRRDNVNVFGANFTVGGSITGNSKNFSIPHPTKEGKRLVHSCLEGPEIGVYFRGRSQSSTIEMPDYWDGLVHLDSMTVELTAIGPNQDLYVADIADDGDVTVASNTETPLNYFYVVYGERKDLERLEIEIDNTVEVEEAIDN